MAAAPCPSCKGAAGSGCRDCGSSHSSLGLRQTSVQYPLPRAPTFRHQEGAIFDIATEKECRSILVRYCAHVPRNFQYRDGVQVVFLILRDHLGDRDLGIAGGVLYELIEVDCAHSDDPGAGFQRWRRDHMKRHADFDLPHIPHLTTVTSAVKPSSILVRWRLNHPSRYPIRLSDHDGVTRQTYSNPTCLSSRKAWAIDHTMYTSTRDGGTSIFRSISPKRFHRSQWNLEGTEIGKFVGEREFVLKMDRPCVTARPGSDSQGVLSRAVRCLKSSSAAVAVRFFGRIRKLCSNQNDASLERSQTAAAWRDEHICSKAPIPTVQSIGTCFPGEGCEIPNPIFARKHFLIPQGRPLPPSMARQLMRTADSVSPSMDDAAVDTACAFRGPFTPQLGFDGGHDFQWEVSPRGASSLATGGGKGQGPPPRRGRAVSTRRKVPHQNIARRPHDWFGLDANLPPPHTDKITTKPPIRQYNWFGLD